jgi:aristolochene synthase
MEWMLSDTIQSMRTADEALTSDLVEGFVTLLQTQTAPERTTIKHLGPYLELREIDVGRPYVFMEAGLDRVNELTGF